MLEMPLFLLFLRVFAIYIPILRSYSWLIHIGAMNNFAVAFTSAFLLAYCFRAFIIFNFVPILCFD